MSDSPTTEQRTIEQINRMVRGIVEVETLNHFYWVGGKVERFHQSDLGHIYFELVDGSTRIRCMIAERMTKQIGFEMSNDIEVEVYGDVQVYESTAQITIQVLKAKLIDGHGKSTISTLTQLKQDGLYPKTSNPVPNPIRQIGIITSRSSRAIGDFEKAYQTRGQKAVLAPVKWQYVTLEGKGAVESIIDSIQQLENNPEIDIIAIIRGGGRYENLATFDHLEIARSIAQSEKYVVTGIGHDRDGTMADEVSDYSASTPTAVAHYIANLCLENQTNSEHQNTQSSTLLFVLIGAIAVMFIIIVILLLLNFQ